MQLPTTPITRVCLLPAEQAQRDAAEAILSTRARDIWTPEWRDVAQKLAKFGSLPFDLGLAPCRVRFSQASFDFDDTGTRALLVPVTNLDAQLIDVAALELSAPFRAATYGTASFCIGAHCIPFSNSLGGSLEVHETIWTWLEAGASGIVITSHRLAARALTDLGVSKVVVSTLRYGKLLNKRLHRALPLPEILVGEVAP